MYVDADVLYAYLKPNDWLKKYAEKIMKMPNLVTSAITITELELVSKRDFDDDFSNNVLLKLSKLKNLKIIDLSKEILAKAAEIRKEHKLNIFDSIHAATAIIKKEKIIVSSDSMFDLADNIKRKDPRVF